MFTSSKYLMSGYNGIFIVLDRADLAVFLLLGNHL